MEVCSPAESIWISKSKPMGSRPRRRGFLPVRIEYLRRLKALQLMFIRPAIAAKGAVAQQAMADRWVAELQARGIVK